jgi:F-type H+-transporting ATPase subunit a
MNVLASVNIEVGVHRTVTVFGFALNIDTIWTTAIAGVIVIGLGLALRLSVTKAVPTKVQVFWETIVETIEAQVEENVGKPSRFVVPLAVTIFVFVLVANWLELLPSDGYLRSPSADVNFTYALALLVIIWAHANGVRHVGFRHYVKHVFFPPGRPAWLAPFNLIEEIVRPFTLALRLFGNMLAGGIMLSVIALLPFYITPALGEAAWDLFDMFIGLIQAGIFALLTILYFGFATATEEKPEQKSQQRSQQRSQQKSQEKVRA